MFKIRVIGRTPRNNAPSDLLKVEVWDGDTMLGVAQEKQTYGIGKCIQWKGATYQHVSHMMTCLNGNF